MISFIDLFCGAGGASTGYVQAGFECKYAVDSEQVFLDSHKANHPETKHLRLDIGESLDTDIWDELDVDMIHGSPPCQLLSGANNLSNPEEGMELVNAFREIIRRVKPKWWVMENVLTTFKFLGSDYPVRLKLNSADLGLHQTRIRVFAGDFVPPILTHKDRWNNWRDLDRPSFTVTASEPKWSGNDVRRASRQMGRLLTIEEMKDIQGFPPDYILKGTKRQQYTQIGNAVPPLFTKAIGDAIMGKNANYTMREMVSW